MQETQVHQEDPLGEATATHSSILAWIIPWTEEPGGYSPWGHKELDTTERLTLSLFHCCLSKLLGKEKRPEGPFLALQTACRRPQLKTAGLGRNKDKEL